jgi:hypothetical protein
MPATSQPRKLRVGQVIHEPQPAKWSSREIVGLVGILVGNILAFIGYATGQLLITDILLLFCLQSIVIGGFNAARMASLLRFSTDGVTWGEGASERPVPEITLEKWKMVLFFIVHYGFFHAVYLGILFTDMEVQLATLAEPWVILALVSFIVGEAFDFTESRRLDRDWKPNIGTMMFTPYLRVVPMHAAVFAVDKLGALSGFVFLPLRTGVDVGMVLIQRHYLDERRRAIAIDEAKRQVQQRHRRSRPTE